MQRGLSPWGGFASAPPPLTLSQPSGMGSGHRGKCSPGTTPAQPAWSSQGLCTHALRAQQQRPGPASPSPLPARRCMGMEAWGIHTGASHHPRGRERFARQARDRGQRWRLGGWAQALGTYSPAMPRQLVLPTGCNQLMGVTAGLQTGCGPEPTSHISQLATKTIV